MNTIKEEDEKSNGSDTAYFSPENDFNERDDDDDYFDPNEEYKARLERLGFDDDEDNQPYD